MTRRVQVRLQAGADGVLRWAVPGCEPGAFYQVVVTLEPEEEPPPRTPEELGYTREFLEKMAEGWQGELERPPHGEHANTLDPTAPAIRTATDLARSEAVGLWADRTDLGDSREFARRLREQAERRGGQDDAAGH